MTNPISIFQVGDIVAHRDTPDDTFLIIEEYRSDLLGNTITPETRSYYKMLRLSDGEYFTFSKSAVEELSIKVS